MTIKIKHKRGTASNITTANPTLAAGELAFETDTRRFKVGDGTTAWSSLSYVTPYVTATDRILGRSSAGAGSAEEITCGSFGRSLIGSADAAAARTTLSVQPTASPAFTGAATVTNDGNVVPLTITNTGTANSFVVNDASGDTTPFVIDAAGGVGVGGSPSAIAKLHVLGDLPASASTQGFRMTGEIPSAATSSATSYISFPSTQAASFTCAALYHYRAFQGTFGAGSAVTSQFGYHADASLTGATNNYGFYSDIASGTGRFNFYANGTAANYFAGQLLVGTTTAFNATDGIQIGRSNIPGIVIARTEAPTSTASIAGINATAYDGSAYVAGATINFRAAENWSSTNHGTDIQFRTTPTGSGGSLTETLRLTGAGQLLVTAGSGSSGSYKPGVAVSGDDDTGLQQVGGAGTISIVTQGSERVRVDASGNVGIGASPSFKLDVSGVGRIGNGVSQGNPSSTDIKSTAHTLLSGTGGNYLAFGQYGDGANYAQWMQATFDNPSTAKYNIVMQPLGGEVLIGTTTDNGAYLLQVNSQIYATNATIATSDARFKTNVEALTDATAVIAALRPVAFDFIPHAERNFATERQVGLIAQEAQSALAGTDYADSVVAQCGDHLGLAYEKLVPVLIKALQESNARIAALEERVNHA